MPLTRRRFLTVTGASALTMLAGRGYAFGVEPGLMLERTRYAITPPRWPMGTSLKIAILADIHACEPWMSARRIRAIGELANGMTPDLIVLLGDFNAGHNFVTAAVEPEQWGEALSVLKAPLGVYAILGNHDWWHGVLPKARGDEARAVRQALQNASIRVLENDAIRLEHRGMPFWLAGLADQLAIRIGRGQYRGLDDLNGTLRQVSDDAPIILLAHEPFVFDHVTDRVAITLCGHTHGGQVNLPLFGPAIAARRFGKDHVYGHIVENGRHMVISAGLGTSYAPVRFMRPPEIVELDLGGPALAGPVRRLGFT